MDVLTEPSLVDPWIQLRMEPQPPDDTHFVIRFEDHHINNLLKRAMSNRLLYKPILEELEIAGEGALTVSSFALRNGWTLPAICRNFRYSYYRSVTMRELRQNHLVVWPTTYWRATGDRAPCSDVHYDIIVSTDTADVPPVLLEDGRSKPERQAGFAQLARLFNPVLELWSDLLEIPKIAA